MEEKLTVPANRLTSRAGLGLAGAVLNAGLLSLVSAGVSEASPISSGTPSVSQETSQSAALDSWPAFLAGGKSLWTTQSPPPITPAITDWMDQSVFLPNPTSHPVVQYLLWRRSLDPAQFDQWHPQLGPELAHLTSPSTPPTTMPTPTPKSPPPHPHPHVPPSKTPTPHGPGSPQIIPEPGTASITLGLVLVGFLWNRRSVPVRSP